MSNMKEHLKFAASVLAVYAVCKLVQSKVQIPVIGAYLPGAAS